MPESRFNRVQKTVSRAARLKQEKKWAEAQELLEEGLADYPDDNFLKVSLADLFVRRDRLDEARDLLEEVLGRNPGDTRALMVRGNIAYRQNDYQNAFEFYQQAYSRKEDKYLASRLIRTYSQLGQHEQALSLCQEWRERDPENSHFMKLKAAVLKKMGETERAQQAYREYLDEKPEDDFAYRENIKLKLKNKPPEQAVRELRTLLRVGERGKNSHLRSLLAENLEKLTEYEEAVSEYRKALESDPENNYIRKRLGFLLVKIGREEEALPLLKKAFTANPADYYTRSSLLSAFRSLDKISEAIEFFKGVIRENPSFNNLWGIVKKLERENKE